MAKDFSSEATDLRGRRSEPQTTTRVLQVVLSGQPTAAASCTAGCGWSRRWATPPRWAPWRGWGGACSCWGTASVGLRPECRRRTCSRCRAAHRHTTRIIWLKASHFHTTASQVKSLLIDVQYPFCFFKNMYFWLGNKTLKEENFNVTPTLGQWKQADLGWLLILTLAKISCPLIHRTTVIKSHGNRLINNNNSSFWDCPKLKIIANRCWGIQKELFSILNINLPLSPQSYIIGALPKRSWGERKLCLLNVLLLIMRKIINTLTNN